MLISTNSGLYSARPNDLRVPMAEAMDFFGRLGFEAVDVNFAATIYDEPEKHEPILDGDWQQSLDAVLAAMLRCSRGQASELVTAGRVEINHLPAEKPSAPVYEGDVFTVRGKGRFALTALPGKSKKERLIIEFFQY